MKFLFVHKLNIYCHKYRTNTTVNSILSCS